MNTRATLCSLAIAAVLATGVTGCSDSGGPAQDSSVPPEASPLSPTTADPDKGDQPRERSVPEISSDCSHSDFAPGGVTTRADCSFVTVEMTVWEDADRVLSVQQQWVHGDSYMRSMAFIPDNFDSVDHAVQSFQEDPGFFDQSEWHLAQEVQSLTTDAQWTVADFVAAGDLVPHWSVEGHTLIMRYVFTDALSTAGATWDSQGGALIFDSEQEFNSNKGTVSITFPGPVESTNGFISGNTVTWNIEENRMVNIEAVYRP